MTKKLVALIILGVFLSSSAFAMCGMCGSGEEKGLERGGSKAVNVGNTICPVLGNKVDMKNPTTVEYKGKIYNLCCPMCIDEFNKNPDKYIAKIKEQKP